MTKQTNKHRLRLIFMIFTCLLILSWTLINSYYDWGTGAIQYIFLGTFSIFFIWIFPKIGIDIYGIDDNWRTDLFIGIGLGLLLIFLSVLSLVGSFAYGTGLLSVRVFGAGIIETSFFFVLIIPFINTVLFKKSKNIFVYLLVLLIAGAIFAFFHYAVVTQRVSGINPINVSGFYISVILLTIIWGFTLRLNKSALPLIVSHMILNFYILYTSKNPGENLLQAFKLVTPLIHLIH